MTFIYFNTNGVFASRVLCVHQRFRKKFVLGRFEVGKLGFVR